MTPGPPPSNFVISYGPSALMTLPAGEVPAPSHAVKTRPGPAYFGVDGIGIVRLGFDGSMKKILSHPTVYQDLVAAADGRTVWAGSDDGVFRITGGQVQRVSDLSAVEVAPAPEGGVVVLALEPDPSK